MIKLIFQILFKIFAGVGFTLLVFIAFMSTENVAAGVIKTDCAIAPANHIFCPATYQTPTPTFSSLTIQLIKGIPCQQCAPRYFYLHGEIIILFLLVYVFIMMKIIRITNTKKN